jgi:uncharacterized coiled-coil protein SlyX
LLEVNAHSPLPPDALAELRRVLAETQGALQSASDRLRALQDEAQSIEVTVSEKPLAPLRERICLVLGREPVQTWRAEALIGELERRGWLPPGRHGGQYVRRMLADMLRGREVRRVGHGMYRAARRSPLG